MNYVKAPLLIALALIAGMPSGLLCSSEGAQTLDTAFGNFKNQYERLYSVEEKTDALFSLHEFFRYHKDSVEEAFADGLNDKMFGSSGLFATMPTDPTMKQYLSGIQALDSFRVAQLIEMDDVQIDEVFRGKFDSLQKQSATSKNSQDYPAFVKTEGRLADTADILKQVGMAKVIDATIAANSGTWAVLENYAATLFEARVQLFSSVPPWWPATDTRIAPFAQAKVRAQTGKQHVAELGAHITSMRG